MARLEARSYKRGCLPAATFWRSARPLSFSHGSNRRRHAGTHDEEVEDLVDHSRRVLPSTSERLNVQVSVEPRHDRRVALRTVECRVLERRNVGVAEDKIA